MTKRQNGLTVRRPASRRVEGARETASSRRCLAHPFRNGVASTMLDVHASAENSGPKPARTKSHNWQYSQSLTRCIGKSMVNMTKMPKRQKPSLAQHRGHILLHQTRAPILGRCARGLRLARTVLHDEKRFANLIANPNIAILPPSVNARATKGPQFAQRYPAKTLQGAASPRGPSRTRHQLSR